jgi:hypothetical protein
MISELIVTSAPRGLKAGQSGFTTVLRTRGIHPELASRLEAASGYRHVFPQGDPRNPTIFAYTHRPSSVGEMWVMSRVGDAGTDYTGRSNKIAHHIALQRDDLLPLAQSNPAAVMADLAARGGFKAKWQGDPREAHEPPLLPVPVTPPTACERWARVSGDPGWAGLLVERALNKETTWVIVPAGTDLLALFAEALALVHPDLRWQLPFTTYSLRGDEGRWLGTIAGSAEAEAAAAQKRIPIVDLTRRASAPVGGPYARAARGLGSVPWARATTSVTSTAGAAKATGGARQQSPAPAVAGNIQSSTQQATPPMLAPMRRGTAVPPPDLPEWEEVDLTKRSWGRLAALASIGTVFLATTLPLLIYAAYLLNWLPTGIRTPIEVAAWRYRLPGIRPPQHIDDAMQVTKRLEEIDGQLAQLLPRPELEGHPVLAEYLYEKLPAVLADLKRVTADTTARDAQHTELPLLVKGAEGLVTSLAPFVKDAALRKAHQEAASVLKAQKAKSPTGDHKNTRELLALTEAAKSLQPESRQEIETALAALTNPGPREPEGTRDNGPTEPVAPSVAGMLAHAIANRNHMPLEGINTDLRESPYTVTLAKWTPDADGKSLKEVTLWLPTGEACRLKEVRDNKDEPSREWDCVVEEDREIGTFRLSTSSLSFRCKSPEHLRASSLPFLPLAISFTGDSESDGQKPTWVQMISPIKCNPLAASPKSNLTDVFMLSHGTPPVAEDIAGLDSGLPPPIWKQCNVRVVGGDVSVQLARQGSFEFKDVLPCDDLQLSGTTNFWWRPAGFAQDTPDRSAFCEHAEIRVVTEWANGSFRIITEGQFDVDSSISEAVRREVDNRRLRNLLSGTNIRAGKITASAWDSIVTLIVKWGLTVPHTEWTPRTPIPREKEQLLRSYYPEKRGAAELEFHKWMLDLETRCRECKEFDGYVATLAEERLKNHRFHSLDAPPSSAPNKDDPAYQKQVNDYRDAEKDYTAKLQVKKDELCSDARILMAWANEQVTTETPSGARVSSRLWRCLHNFHKALEHNYVYDESLLSTDNASPLKDLRQSLAGCTFSVSGALVLDWQQAFPSLGFQPKMGPSVLLVTFSEPPANESP